MDFTISILIVIFLVIESTFPNERKREGMPRAIIADLSPFVPQIRKRVLEILNRRRNLHIFPGIFNWRSFGSLESLKESL